MTFSLAIGVPGAHAQARGQRPTIFPAAGFLTKFSGNRIF
jgi:hypothetical protein